MFFMSFKRQLLDILSYIQNYFIFTLQMCSTINTHSCDCERGAEVLLVDPLQQSLPLSVRPVQDQNLFTCRESHNKRLRRIESTAEVQTWCCPHPSDYCISVKELWMFTWCRYDRLHVILVQFQFVSGVDHLNNGSIFLSYLLQLKRIHSF